MDGQLLKLKIKNLKKFIKNISVFRPSSLFCTAMEIIVLTTYIGLACLQHIIKE